MFTDELINELIDSPKKIIDSPKEIKGWGSYSKKIFILESVNGQYTFGGFICYNSLFHENFSIGLVYHPKDEKGRICLLRCNGPHGEHKDAPHHLFTHIHTVTADDINNGIKKERHIVRAEYSTLEDAIQYYVKRVNIVSADRQKYFPPPSPQIAMLFNDEDRA
jgi:hypothetical protein